MDEPEAALLEQLSALDPRLISVKLEPAAGEPVSPYAIDINISSLLAAISAAALSAGTASQTLDLSEPLSARKELVDGAATSAAEAIFGQAPVNLTVKAGEGQRDSSPGATTGQHLGSETGKVASVGSVDGVFDYVDGTGLAAERAPGALALGSLGRGIRSVPDLQSYAITAPRQSVPALQIMLPPEQHAASALNEISKATGRAIRDLTVFTHSVNSSNMHQTLIDLLRPSVNKLIVPETVTVEPPYVLSLAGITKPLVDSMIGAVGLTELVFAATLLDLICPAYGFAFRAGSVTGPRKDRESLTLDPLFRFTDEEMESFAQAGLEVNRQFSNLDLVPEGGAIAAAVFAVTEDPHMGLSAPGMNSDRPATSGFLIMPQAQIMKISLQYESGEG